MCTINYEGTAGGDTLQTVMSIKANYYNLLKDTQRALGHPNESMTHLPTRVKEVMNDRHIYRKWLNDTSLALGMPGSQHMAQVPLRAAEIMASLKSLRSQPPADLLTPEERKYIEGERPVIHSSDTVFLQIIDRLAPKPTQSKILPCPFCGREPIVDPAPPYASYTCSDRACPGGVGFWELKYWNRRTP